MANKIEVKTTFGSIVVEVGADPNYNELYVDAYGKNGEFLQTLACVRESYHYDNTKSVKEEVVNEGKAEILVWGNKLNEDYTDKFTIELLKESEEL